MGMSWRGRKRTFKLKMPTLRFRAKIVTGFAIVLAISAASLGIAYLGFERVSASVATYRNSVSEADLARNIDRELISYQALARYYVVTGKEDDATAALAAEANLKAAIDQSMRGISNPGRLDQITRLAREFKAFTRIFADILKVKRDSALVVQNRLGRGANMLRYKLDDLPGNAGRCRAPGDPVRCEEGGRPIPGGHGAREYVRHQFRSSGRRQRDGTPEVRRERAASDVVEGRKDQAGPQGGRGPARRISAGVDQADREFEGNR